MPPPHYRNMVLAAPPKHLEWDYTRYVGVAGTGKSFPGRCLRSLCRWLLTAMRSEPLVIELCVNTSVLHTKENSQRQRQAWEITIMLASRTKGCRLKYIRMGHNSTIVYFLSKVLPLSMLHNSLIYFPSMGSEGSKWSISRNMEGQGSSHSLLDGEKYKYFLFLRIYPDVRRW